MATLHLKLGVLTLVAAAMAGTANGYLYFIEVDTPSLPSLPIGALPFPFGSSLFGSTRDVILDFHNKSGDGWTQTVPGFALPGTDRPFRLHHWKLIDPCRITLQLKEDSGSSTTSSGDIGLWISTRIDVVVYHSEEDDKAEIYRRRFEVKKPVTVSCPVSVNLCEP